MCSTRLLFELLALSSFFAYSFTIPKNRVGILHYHVSPFLVVNDGRTSLEGKSSSSSSSSSALFAAGGVVITGGANGVGFAYAGEFLDRGFDVVICDIQDSTTAAKALAARHGNNGRIFHTQCDVSNPESVQKLGIFAKENLGTITHWINNAGINGGRRSLREVPFGMVEAVVKVNLLGILYCTKVAMDIMADQVRFMFVSDGHFDWLPT
jgi:hypothetical protein